MFTFLLVLHGLIAAALVGVILVQKSEGGGLGMGSGGPSGLMSARGAADFLTRATSVLAGLFILMALILAAYASMRSGGGDIDTSLAHQAAPGPINAPTTPTSAIPMIGGPAPTASTPATVATPAPAPTAATAAPAPAPTVSRLRKIDTHAGNDTVGINGVGTGSSAPRSAAPVETAPTVKMPAPAPAKSDAASSASGNGAQSQ